MTNNSDTTPQRMSNSLLASESRITEIRGDSSQWLSYGLKTEQITHLELLLNGAYAPLAGYLCRDDYESVCGSMTLTDGTFWPMPICLDIDENLAAKLNPGDYLALRDSEGFMLAVMKIKDIWQPDIQAEDEALFGSTEAGDRRGQSAVGCWYVGGEIEGVSLPIHYDFRELRLTPDELKHEYSRLGWRRIAGYHTAGFIHRAEHKLMLRTAQKLEANLLLLPTVGNQLAENREHYSLIRSYSEILRHHPLNTALLALNPLEFNGISPREVLQLAVIHRNYGCTHFIINPAQSASHSIVGDESTTSLGKLIEKHSSRIGIEIVLPKALSYVEDLDAYLPEDETPDGARTLNITTDDLRQRLSLGRDIPDWFSFPNVVSEMRKAFPPRSRQGFTVFFSGLSGSGKSTVANVLLVKLMEMGSRPVTLLDGDIVRQNLSSELGFSKKDRNTNIRRIGYVASEITKNGGIAICAPIAPYDTIRLEVRKDVELGGGFILIHVSTPLDVCEARDRKGLYAKARAGIIKEFTGISDPYEIPTDADMAIDTSNLKPEEAAQQIVNHLEHLRYIDSNGNGPRT